MVGGSGEDDDRWLGGITGPSAGVSFDSLFEGRDGWDGWGVGSGLATMMGASFEAGGLFCFY
jgi:hypothetical protein